MEHFIRLVSRLLAALLACCAYYFAFFLYEDEEGIWQNRIDNLWIAIAERATVTKSNATALFNKISEVIQSILNRALGVRLLSFRAIVVSTYFSLLTALTALA